MDYHVRHFCVDDYINFGVISYIKTKKKKILSIIVNYGGFYI
jgi:hypothetical protein